MNDELRDRLMGYLKNMEKAVEGGADFVIQQAPLYVQEVISWEIAYNCIWAIFWFGIIIALPLVLGKPAKKLRGSGESDPRVFGWVITVGMGFAIFCSTVISLSFAGDGIKAYVAPRVVIVEKLAELNK